MRVRVAAFAAFLLFLLPGARADGLPGLKFEQQDWELYCDNTGTCRAAGYQQEGPPVSVLLTRAAGPDAPVTAQMGLGDTDSVNAEQPVGERLPAKFALGMRINGRAMGSLPSESAQLSGVQTTALLAALKGSSRIDFHYKKFTWRLSGSGAMAVLLKMDDYQRRTGTPSALVRPGTASQSKVLRPVPPPVLKQVAPAEERPADKLLATTRAAPLVEALRRSDNGKECLELFPYTDTDPVPVPELTIRRLSTTHLLVSTFCNLRITDPVTGFWVIEDTPAFNPVLVTAHGDGFNSMGNEIRVTTESGRPSRDCMAYQDWNWNGSRFVMTNWVISGGCGRGMGGGGVWSTPRMVTEVVDANAR